MKDGQGASGCGRAPRAARMFHTVMKAGRIAARPYYSFSI
jgi:hypothetical protein